MYIAIDRKDLCIWDVYRIEVLIKCDYASQYEALLKKLLSTYQYENSQRVDGTYKLSKHREAILKQEIQNHNTKHK